MVRRATKVILPGVGHFQATQLLEETGLTSAVSDAIARGIPFLGICVGLQWLFEGSTEAPAVKGLSLFRGECERFAPGVKVPHVGWNEVRVDPLSRLMRGVEDRAFVYYTHSYRAPVVTETVAVTDLRWSVLRGSGKGQRDGGAVSSGEVRGGGHAGVAQFCGVGMLTKRIIACLDVRNGRVVKGVQFVDLVDAGDPAELAKRHAAAGADEIVLLDITATHEGRGTLLDTVRRAARELFIPFTVGGGIRSADDASAVFDAGADKVSINSAAIADPGLIDAIGRSFGAQAVIVAIDARRATDSGDPVGLAEVFVSGGRTRTGRQVIEWAREAEARGAGEILLTSMDADGTKAGFDCELTARVSEAVEIPVIASGGAGTAEHFVEVFQAGKAHAALAASIFHFGIADVRALKQELALRGVPVRLPC